MPNPIDILLVEDNPADADLTLESFETLKVANRLHHVSDGEQALAFLRRQGPYETSPRPDLLLLDLNLPRKDGREVLAEIKHDESLRQIPVVVLTSSDDETDVVRTYDLHANCYVRKPIQLDGLHTIVSAIESFWLSVVRLPPKRSADAA